jgi:hypothetical protein
MDRKKIVVIGNGMGESMRLRSEASRIDERPAKDGRAGLSRGGTVSPGTALPGIDEGRNTL